jgi:hypothetical protein
MYKFKYNDYTSIDLIIWSQLKVLLLLIYITSSAAVAISYIYIIFLQKTLLLCITLINRKKFIFIFLISLVESGILEEGYGSDC